jgi:hypothetical protein
MREELACLPEIAPAGDSHALTNSTDMQSLGKNLNPFACPCWLFIMNSTSATQ